MPESLISRSQIRQPSSILDTTIPTIELIRTEGLDQACLKWKNNVVAPSCLKLNADNAYFSFEGIDLERVIT